MRSRRRGQSENPLPGLPNRALCSLSSLTCHLLFPLTDAQPLVFCSIFRPHWYGLFIHLRDSINVRVNIYNLVS